ncbi:hypothetical protein Acr_00g0012980 [Actinidia rufa]|uniref:Reverse transcriptase domain-containing protein n=1 Tax=Actinidia rufa TaxID=165716 RepID=A0A7J0DA25_9ERIC|nr:hypothetical protein Acr_00g0012980 [Actinidia rufa]
MLLGDFNNVLSSDEKANGLPVTMYEIRDFKNCCYDLGISDLRSTGLFLTWTNSSVWCKLDRAMVNIKWIQEGHIAQANYDPPGKLSDHSPCTVSMLGENDQGNCPFKFFNMWTKHEKFPEIVSKVWRMQPNGTAMYKFCRKLRSLKVPLRALNRHHFSHISARAEAAEVELSKAQQQLHDNPADANLQNLVPELRQKALKLAEAELSFCSQLAKSKYLKNCDNGTKFFHNLIKSNRVKNHIASISLEDGSRTSSKIQVGKAFVQYYRSLLGTKRECTSLNRDTVLQGKLLNADQAECLIRPISDEEIKAALFSIGDDKAPGPDGYSSCFYKHSWDIIAMDFTAAVKEFFTSGEILKQINHAVITLIPKSKNADSVEEFRPIACCNVIYKVISKLIATRLAEVLPSIIDPAQAAFVQNRSMKDNIFLLQELLRQYGRKRSSPRCILNVDLRKAFDSLDWDFVHDMLSSLQFPPMFINWIMTCITSTSYSISYNGSLHGFFKGNRGLRQGDPLSPSLFVIYLEYLSRSLGRLKENSNFNFHPKCGGLKITHLAFVDDLVLFSRGDQAGIGQQDMEIIKAITSFSQGSFPFRYLGIPVADSRLSIAQYSPMIDKVLGYISAWAGANLSYAGRLELIKSVLQGVECFWLSILPTLAGVQAKIIQLCRNFLWSGKRSENKRPLVAWKDITLPKIEGGLGIRNSKAWNKALLSKTMWDIQLKKDSLWVQWWMANGELNSKLAYEYFRPKANKLLWPKVIWTTYTTPKHAFILWLAMKERLLTKDKLHDPAADQMCSLCRTENETAEHLFFQCNFTSVKGWLGFRRSLSTLKAAVKWSIKEARGTGIQSKAKRLGIACTTYFVWEARNLRTF